MQALALKILGGIWGYVAAGIFAAALSVWGTHYIDANSYGRQIAGLKLEASEQKAANVTASLAQLQGFISRMNLAGADYQQALSRIDVEYQTLLKGLKDAIAKTPLPPDCKPDIGRLRSLTAAARAANGASSPSP